MAVLTTSQRRAVWRRFNARLQELNIGDITTLKEDVFTAIGDMDTWIENNQTAFNLAISQPARANLTAKQKVALFVEVLTARFKES